MRNWPLSSTLLPTVERMAPDPDAYTAGAGARVFTFEGLQRQAARQAAQDPSSERKRSEREAQSADRTAHSAAQSAKE